MDDSGNNEEDECELFGKRIAKKLRKISEEDREELEIFILQVFRQYKQKIRL